MNPTHDERRLRDLLMEPTERLDFEAKSWLDLKNSNADKATLAKAIIALANHGGGYVVIGWAEEEGRLMEAKGRPATLDGYSQDQINGIVQKYCDPPFQCGVSVTPDEADRLFPIVYVPGGHRTPVRARRASPDGRTVKDNEIYMRKPGPRSETPRTSREWDELLGRCLRNRRNEMLDQIRHLFTGDTALAEEAGGQKRLDEWMEGAFKRWKRLVGRLPDFVGPRLAHGHYSIAYEILDGEKRETGTGFQEVLQRSVVRHTGWPPFWYPTREGIEPYSMDGSTECWLGGDSQARAEEIDGHHSDFWRIHPDGLAFLLRGYQEDAKGVQQVSGIETGPGTMFDITRPIWRVGEAMLHARSLAKNLFDGATTIRFVAEYTGLRGRSLVSLNPHREVWDRRIAQQESIRRSTHVETKAIDPNLPEIVHGLLTPLYELFGFYELRMELVAGELRRMRTGAF